MGATRIGVLGGGKMQRKTAVALLKDFVNDRQVEFYIVADPFPDAGRFAADWALMNGVPTTIFTGLSPDEDYADYSDAQFLEREDTTTALLTVLERAEGSALLYAFEETAEEEALLMRFLKAGIEVLDFAEGLHPVTLEDDGQPDAVEVPASAEEQTPEPETPADPDAGLEPEPEDTVVIPDEAQQPPARKPRTRKPKVVEEPAEEQEKPTQTVQKAFMDKVREDAAAQATHQENCAFSDFPPLGSTGEERYLNSPQVQELIALGRATKTLLDYIKGRNILG